MARTRRTMQRALARIGKVETSARPACSQDDLFRGCGSRCERVTLDYNQDCGGPLRRKASRPGVSPPKRSIVRVSLGRPFALQLATSPKAATMARSGATAAHRLEGEACGGDCHDDVQGGTNVDRDGGGGIGIAVPGESVGMDGCHRHGMHSRGDDCADDTHYAVEADGDTVAGAAVGGRKDFGGIGVQRAVVDILGPRSANALPKALTRSPTRGIKSGSS